MYYITYNYKKSKNISKINNNIWKTIERSFQTFYSKIVSFQLRSRDYVGDAFGYIHERYGSSKCQISFKFYTFFFIVAVSKVIKN